MTEDQRELLEEARDSIAAAGFLLDGGYPGYAASRARTARRRERIRSLFWI